MINRHISIGLIAIVWFIACGTLKPVTVNVGDTCYGCRCHIVEPRQAGEMIDPNGLAYKFHGPRCMARYVATHPSEQAALFVTDFATGHMIEAARASYVPVIVDPNTMQPDYRAHLRRVDAETFAKTENAAVLTWAAVLDKARG